MAEPGWYPDPAGRERHFRYWDGAHWATSTTRAPAAPDPKRPNFALVATLVVAAVTILALIAWSALGTTGAPTAGDSPTPIAPQYDGPVRGSTTPSPSAIATRPATPVPCPTPGPSILEAAPAGRLSSSALTLELPAGWEPSASEVHRGLTRHSSAVRPYAETGWLSFMSLGLAAFEAGHAEPRVTARQLARCHVTGSRFSGLTGQEILLDEPVTIDGAQGWRVRLAAGSTRAPGGGATYDVVALDTGLPEGLSVFWSGLVDADQVGLAAVEATIATIEVSG